MASGNNPRSGWIGALMASEVMVDPETLRGKVMEKYREVAANPRGSFHFHTGRLAAVRLGYDEGLTASFPDSAIESFAGVANPFSLHSLSAGERVVDLGSGGGYPRRYFSMEYPSERVLIKATMASSSFPVRPRLPSSFLLMLDETSGSGQQFSPGLGSLNFSHLPSTSLVL